MVLVAVLGWDEGPLAMDSPGCPGCCVVGQLGCATAFDVGWLFVAGPSMYELWLYCIG